MFRDDLRLTAAVAATCLIVCLVVTGYIAFIAWLARA